MMNISQGKLDEIFSSKLTASQQKAVFHREGPLLVIAGPGSGKTRVITFAAAGLLVLTVGKATRLSEYVLESDKRYWAEIVLGLRTDTADAQGTVIARASAADITEAQVRQAIGGLTGAVSMRPPAHSAVHVGGRRMYELAQRGQAVEAPERTVMVHEWQHIEFVPGHRALVRAEIACSKGAYIRSLAEMLGESLGCGAMLGALVRTEAGASHLCQAVTLEELAAGGDRCLTPIAEALPHLPQVRIGDQDLAAFGHGNPVTSMAELPAGPILVMSEGAEVVGIGLRGGVGDRLLCPHKVLVEAPNALPG